MTNTRGQLVGRPIYFSNMMDVEGGDGNTHAFFAPVQHLGVLRDVDMTVAGSALTDANRESYALRMRPYLYRMSKLSVGLPIGTIGAINLSIYTGRDKSGDKLLDITPTGLAPLAADPYAIVEFALPNVHRSADWLHIYVNTVNADPLKLSFWAYGDVLIADDKRGTPI
ncbi:hypothetical protein [Methylobacterium sp. Leaf93]|uniref:hypothetical protein n=1 Tax=Methylobacterium sp. Leaf93 TaxID=1736249 RepID=UPI000700F812|nr:hypothetical protein [Methylobacterium sp. Leaf93]KQP02672.1 hypothetical protein ASF26_14680 [Methylobacterium sp. Leaf93]